MKVTPKKCSTCAKNRIRCTCPNGFTVPKKSRQDQFTSKQDNVVKLVRKG